MLIALKTLEIEEINEPKKLNPTYRSQCIVQTVLHLILPFHMQIGKLKADTNFEYSFGNNRESIGFSNHKLIGQDSICSMFVHFHTKNIKMIIMICSNACVSIHIIQSLLLRETCWPEWMNLLTIHGEKHVTHIFLFFLNITVHIFCSILR